MIYEEYEAIWYKIRKKEKKLFELMDKRDSLFDMTQPKSTPMDKEIVDGKNPINTIEEYLIQDEQQKLSVRIEQINRLLDDWYQALKRKREELRLSKNLYDRIYYYFCIERLSVYKIAHLVNYSQSQVYRILEKMGVEVKDAKKCENKHANMIM